MVGQTIKRQAIQNNDSGSCIHVRSRSLSAPVQARRRGPLGARTGSVKPILLIGLGLAALCIILVLTRSNKTNTSTPVIHPPSVAEVQTLQAKAEKGDSAAQDLLGAAYSKGQGVKQDYQLAAQWYQKAAAQGNAAAQSALGELFEAGQGVPHDDAQAASWYRRAAEQGLAGAQYNLAAMYAVGKGVPMNNAEALKWYLLAANQGDALAQYNVGMRYYEGHGVKPNPVLAYKWLGLSAAQNLPDAAGALESLSARMSRDQLNQARDLMRQFKVPSPKNP